MVVKRIAPLSCAKIAGTLYAILGLVIGGLVSLAGVAGAFASEPGRDSPFGPVFGMFIGIGAIIFLPILYGMFGFIGSLIAAALYNLLAGIVGGIEIEMS